MAVIPSFSAYAPTPNLAEAFLGAERIRQEAAEAAARIQLGREQIASQAVQANMELQAKQQALANESLRRAQEQQIEQAYKQTQLGLAERELKSQEAYNESRIAEAAEGFAARAAYTRAVEGGMPPDAAARRFLAGQTGFAAALNEPAQPRQRTFSAVAGLDPLMMNPPSRVSMTAPEFMSFMETAPPELRTNMVNTTIQRMLQPPSTMTGSSAPRRLRYNPKTGDFE